MGKKEMNYASAKAELEKIVTLIESGDLDVDQLTKYVKRASELVVFCKEKLTKTDEDLKKVLDELDA